MTGYWIDKDLTVMVVQQNDYNSQSLIKKVVTDPTGVWGSSVGQSPFLYGGRFETRQRIVVEIVFGE
jgi:hypothetical protein